MSNNAGNPGTVPGGGGGGGERRNNGGGTNYPGGTGATGQVRISWVQPYYSKSSSNANVLSNWSTKSDGTGAAPTSFAANNQKFTVQTGHHMTTNAAWNVSGTNVQLVVAPNASLAASHVVTLAANVVFQIEGTYRHLVNSAAIWSGVEQIGTASTIEYGFAGTQNIEALPYAHITVSGGGTKTLTAHTAVANNLNLNGAVLETGNFDLTLSIGNITGTFGAANMVSTGGTGKLVVQGLSAAVLQQVYPVGHGGVYNPMQLTAVGTLSATPATVGVRVASGNPLGTSATDLQKHWIVTTTGMTGTVVSASFQYQPADVPATGQSANYLPAYQANSTGDFVQPAGSTVKGVNPFAIANLSNLNGTFTAVGESKVWYALLSGNWDDATIWTLDPSGTLPMPMGGGIPMASDYVVVPNGKVVAVGASNKSTLGMVVQGTLDLGTTTGHNFTKIEGNGRIRLAADNFPAGDATHFISKGAGEGTVIYYGNNFTVSQPRTFCHLEVAMNANQTVILEADHTLNGNLTLLSGTLQINHTSAISRTVSVMGNVELKSGAKCTVGTGNATHAFYANGDIRNSGEIRFTNLTAPTYNAATATGSVTLYARGLSNNILDAGNITYLQRLVVDKGTDRSYRFTVNAADKSFFRLYGQNNNDVADKALYIQNGVLEITGATYIHSLTEGTDFDIPVSGGLWVNSSAAVVHTTARNNAADGFTSTGVTTTNDGAQSLTVRGLFKISNGLVNTNSHGFVVWDAGDALIQIEGGTVSTPGFRSAGGNTGKWTYHQSGGLVQMWGDLQSDLSGTNAATFHIEGENNLFVMSGGEMEIMDAATAGNRAIEIESKVGNFNVTGGTIRIKRDGAGGVPFNIITTAPLYNLAVEGSNASTVVLGSALAVANNLTIGTGHTFNAAGNALGIGKDLTAAGTFTHGNNTVTFNGNQQGMLITGASTLVCYNVELSKSLATQALSQAGTANVEFQGTLQIAKGIWNTADKVLSARGNITIAEGEIQNTTGYTEALINAISVTGPPTGYVKLGNFRVNTANNTVTLGSPAEVNDLQFVGTGNCKLNVGIHALRVNGTITNASTNRYIYGSGLASNGGLELKVTANGTYAFPVGSNKVTGTLKYTPTTLTVSGLTGSGYIAVVPVDDDLATTGGAADLLGYYWKVKPSGFASAPSVTGTFTYVSADVNGTEGNYVPGKVLDASPYTRASINNTAKVDDPTNTILYDVVHTLEKANYTAGVNSRFVGTVEVYYSRDYEQQAKWTDVNAWTFAPNGALSKHHSSQPPAGDYPKAGDVAVIGFVPWDDVKVADRGMPHGMWVDNNTQTCAEVVFTQMTDALGNPVPRVYRSNFQFRPTLCINEAGQLNADYVKGEGMFWLRYSTPNWGNMDMGEFAANDSSYVVYEFNQNTTVTSMPPLYPNVLLATDGWGANNHTVVFTENLSTTGNLELLGNINLRLNNGATGNLKVGRDLLFFEQGGVGGGAQLLYPNNAARTVSVGRDLLMCNNNAVVRIENPGTTLLNHQLSVGRHIHLRTTSATGSGLVLWTAANSDYIPLTLNGTQSMTYTHTNGAVPQLGRLTVNKGTGIATVAQMNGNLILNGATNATPKALEIQSGLLQLNHPSIDVNLTTGGPAFALPASGGLDLQQGQANVSGGSGVNLSGLLRVSGGTLQMGGGDHSIVYDASGNARIEFLSGSAQIGGQIRRDAATEGGILKYTQGATANVQVGTNSASAVANRGTFEVLNMGSSFTLAAGARLKILRGRAGNDVADVWFDPETVSQGAGSGFELGSGDANEMDVYAAKPVSDLWVQSNSLVKLKSLPLTVEGNLEIGSGATFTTDALNLTLYGNFTNRGSYVKNGNTTIFKGTRVQQALGAMGFHYAIKEGGMDLVFGDLDGSTTVNRIQVVNQLQLTSGRILTNRHYLNLAGNLTGNGSILSNDDAQGVVFNTTGFAARQQELSGNLTIDVLKIENPLGVIVPTQGEAVSIQKRLVLSSGVFDIGKNLLSVAAPATIVDGAGTAAFTENNMIQTNISYSDAGVRRYIPAGASQIVFPVGAFGKYTPATWDIASNASAAGSIRIRPANEFHPTIQNLTATAYDETQNVLQYYWVVDAVGISSFTADVVFAAEVGDDPVTISGKTTADYVASQLNQAGQWLKFVEDIDTQTYLEGTHQSLFSFSNANDYAIDGDYTAGIPEAIPNNVQSYESIANGDWTQPSTWKDLSTGLTSTVVPRGAIVNIKHQVTIPASENYQSAYRTAIEPAGTLVLGATFGHRLGTVSGKGKLSLNRGDLPSGVYDAFFSSAGGTLEYDGTAAFDILSNIPAVNNLSIKGTGQKGFPNINVLLYGSLSMTGANVRNDYSKIVHVKGTVSFAGGSYTASNSTLVMSGSVRQDITGDFVGANRLNNLVVANLNGVNVKGKMEVGNKLTLNSGVISTKGNAGASLTLVNNSSTEAVSGGSIGSYVEGALSKLILAGGYFEYPVGDASRYGKAAVYNVTAPGFYAIRYINGNPTPDGYATANMASGISSVSGNEYWTVGSLTQGSLYGTPVYAGDARVAVRYDNLSGVGGNLANIKIAKWQSASGQWAAATGVTENLGGSVLRTSLGQQLNEAVPALQTAVFTFANLNAPATGQWTGNTDSDWFKPANWSNNAVPDLSTNVIIAYSGANMPEITGTTQADCHDLTVTSGVLTAKPGSRVQVNGNIAVTLPGSFVIENTTDNPVSFIHEGTSSGNVTVKITYPAARNWYVGHPMNTSTAAYGAIGASAEVYRYTPSTTTESWTKDEANVAYNTPMQGFVVGTKVAGAVATHTGTLYSGEQSYTLDVTKKNRWDLVANPYNAYINPVAFGAIDYSNVESTVWFRSVIDNAYQFVTVNVAQDITVNADPANPQNLIPPMQAFWVRATASGPFKVGKTARVHPLVANPKLKSAALTVSDVLFVRLYNQATSDETAIATRLVGSTLYTNFDSEKRLSSGKVPSVYTMKSKNRTAINVQPEEPDTLGIPLGVYLTPEANSNLVLSVRNIDRFMPGMEVYLKDNQTGASINLRSQTEYPFTAPVSTVAYALENRFVLQFKKVATGEEEQPEIENPQAESRLRIFGHEGKAVVLVGSELLRSGTCVARVYSLTGQLLHEQAIDQSRTEIDLPDAHTLYVVEAEAGGVTKREKVTK